LEEFNYFTTNKDMFYHSIVKDSGKEVKYDMVICPKMIDYFQTQKEGVLSPIEEFILYHIKRLQGFIERDKFDFLPI